MNSLKRAINYQRINFFKALGIFWAVMLVINTASYISLHMLGKNFVGLRVSGFESVDGVETWFFSVSASNIMPIIIFLIVYCYEMYYEYFPIAISFSVTRKDFYLSTIIDNVAAAFAFAVIQSILMKIDSFIITKLGQNPKIDFGIFNISTDSILFIIVSLFVCFMAFTSIMNLLAALNYKFGYKMWIILGPLLLITLISGSPATVHINEQLVAAINGNMKYLLFIFIAIISQIITYFITIKTNVKNKLV